MNLSIVGTNISEQPLITKLGIPSGPTDFVGRSRFIAFLTLESEIKAKGKFSVQCLKKIRYRNENNCYYRPIGNFWKRPQQYHGVYLKESAINIKMGYVIIIFPILRYIHPELLRMKFKFSSTDLRQRNLSDLMVL
jgi:hypothetical protein